MRSQFAMNLPSMSAKRRLLETSAMALCVAVAVSLAPQSLLADPLYYDNGPDALSLDTVAGTWNDDDAVWNQQSDGSGALETFVNTGSSRAVIFDATGVLVELTEDVSPRSITFNVDGYSIQPQSDPSTQQIAVRGNGGGFSGGLAIDVTNNTDTAIIGANITTSGNTNRPITVNATGTGTLRLTGDNSGAVSTLTLSGGTLDNRGNYGGPVVINGGDFLAASGEIGDAITVSGGDMFLQGGTYSTAGGAGAGQITVSSGSVFVQHGSDPGTDADRAVNVLVNGTGALDIQSGNTLTGTITQAGGTIDNNGIYVGNAGVSAGTFTNAGDVTGRIDVSGTGILIVNSGTITGQLSNANTGNITLNGGTITGGVSNDQGTTTVAGTVSASISNGTGATTGTLNITGAGVLTGAVTNVDGTTTNGGSIIGTASVSGGTFANNGSISGPGTVSVTGGTFNANALSSVAGLLTNDGGIVNANGGTFATGIQNDSGNLNITADGTFPVTNDGGTVTVNSGVTLGGTFINQSGQTQNNGTMTGTVQVDAGTFTNTATGQVQNTVVLNGTGSFVATAGSDVTALLTLNGGDVTVAGDTFSGGILNNAGQVDVTGATTTSITNDGGTVTITGTGAINNSYTSTKGTTTNNGSITGAVTISGIGTDAITDQFANAGTITGDVGISGTATLNNTGSIVGEVSLTGGTLSADGGTFSQEIQNNGGDVNINAATSVDVRNQNGDLTVTAGQTLTGTATILGGNMTIAATANLTGALVVDGGTATQAGDITGTARLDSGTYDANGGQVSGLTTITGGQLNAGGTAFNGGLSAQGGTIIFDGDTTMTTLTNAGSTISVQSGNTLTTNLVNNSGTFTNAGTLDGTVAVNGGEVASSGIITQAVTANAGGTFRSTGGTLQADVVNNGGAIVATGGTYQGQLRTDSGTTTVNGPITVATLENAGGTLTVSAPGVVTGNLLQSGGSSTQAGEVTGTVTVQTGTYGAQGRIRTDLINNGGTITANGAQIDGDVLNNSGSLIVQGPTTGTLTNQSTLTIQSAGVWTGSVTHNGGAATNAGDVTGSLTANGGTWTQNSGSDVFGTTTIETGGSITANGGAFSGGIVANDGSLTIAANTAADIVNNGIGITLGSGLRLTGDFTNASGTFDLSGELIGELAVQSGIVTTNAGSRVSGEARVSGTGQLDVNGGTFDDRILSTSGTVRILGDADATVRNAGATVGINAGANLRGGLVQSSGQATNAGQIGGASTISGGDLTNAGTVTGTLLVSGSGQVDNTGTVAATTTISSSGVFNHDAGALSGDTTLTGGRLNLAGGSVSGDITNNGGIVTVSADTAADVDNQRGELTVQDTQTLTGDVSNDAGVVRLTGTIAGSVENRGTLDHLGVVTGNVSNRGVLNINPNSPTSDITSPSSYTSSVTTPRMGSLSNRRTGVLALNAEDLRVGALTNSGALSISNGRVLTATGGATFNRPGSLTINNGTLVADVTLNEGGTVNLTDATIAGGVSSETLVTSSGTTRILESLATTTMTTAAKGDFAMSGLGELVVSDGLFSVAGNLTTEDSNAIEVGRGATLTAKNLTSKGSLSLRSGATLRARNTVRLTGDSRFRNGASVFGNVVNTGTIVGNGNLRFADGLRGGGRVNLASNNDPVDVVNIGGALGDQTFDLDIDLSDNRGGSDKIVMSSGAFVTGDVTLNFNVVGTGGEQDQDLVVLDVASGQGDFNFTSTGLPGATDFTLTDGILVYGLSRNSAGDLVVFDALDQGVSSIAGTIVLAQSLIGSVINRPSSPFVSGLAFEDEDPCGAGVWARAVGGSADATGEINQLNGSIPAFDSSISADYYGVQLGGDYACFNGFYNGWDLAFGAIGGVNMGKSNQPIFAPDPNQPGGLSDVQTSVTDVDFTQAYGGLYVAAVRDRLAIDLQYRIEKTDYEATNVEAAGRAPLGLTDETFTSDGRTLSGAITYAIPVKETDLTFVPTVGFAYSQVSTDPIHFEGRGVVQIEDFDSKIGFAGGTLSRTKVGADGVSALTQFGTVTIYNDFADSPTSTFTQDDNGEVTRISSENLGTYGEISAGLNYVKILQPGEFGSVKQFNASLRGDIRVSDRLESWGLTAQARLQF